MKIDYIEVAYITNKVCTGDISKEALSQRIGRALKKKDEDLYLTLKLAQAQIRFQEETYED